VTARVLLVEDDDEARDTLTRALRRRGFECEPAADLAGARAAIEGATFDLAVVDMMLHGDEMAGLRLLPELVQQRGVRTVVITAFADVAKVKQALNEGARYLLEKPFGAAELADLLHRLQSEEADFAHVVERALRKAGLTEKETAVARLVLKGLTSAEIARLEGNSEKTVRQHVSKVFAKCGVSSRAELFHYVFPS
jgi:DNA-binding NarL/FixJ family response regulator